MRRSVLVALTALSLVAGACSSDPSTTVDAVGESASDDSGTTDQSSTAGSGGTSSAGDVGEEVDGEGAQDDGPAAGESGPATSGGSSPEASEPAPAASQAPAPSESPAPQQQTSGDTLDPIPAGTYEYDTDGTRQLGDQPPEDLPEITTLAVGQAGGDDVQEQVRDLRDEDGYGSRNTLALRYGVEGAVLLASTIESTVEVLGNPFTSTNELEADPPTTIAPLGADVGFSASFRLVGDDLTVDGTLDIVRREPVTVGGTTIDALVVEVHYDLSGEVEGTSDATWWIRPDDLLNLREESMTDAESQGLRFREQYAAELRSLEPL